MSKKVGVYKELKSNEKLVFESRGTTPTVFVKGVDVKKWSGLETKEVPVAYSLTNVYLTNKRLMFLIHSSIKAQVLKERTRPSRSSMVGTWFEMPISTIDLMDIMRKDIRKDEDIKRLAPSLSKRNNVEAVQLIYDKRRTTGVTKDLIESMFDATKPDKVVKAYDKLYIIGKEIYESLLKQMKLHAEAERIEKLKRRLKKAEKKRKELI